MKNKILFAIALISLGGLAHAAGDAEAGKARAMVCGACHGADGNSPAPTFPKLAGQGEKYLIKQMQDIKSGARSVPTMAGQLDAFDDQAIADVAAYFASQKVQTGVADPDKVALGERLYRAGDREKGLPACTACHSPTGAGNAPAGFPALGGQHAEYIAVALKAFRTGERSNDGDTRVMRDIAYKMNDKEIDAVASYIAGLH
jgi:cytochrome c553